MIVSGLSATLPLLFLISRRYPEEKLMDEYAVIQDVSAS